MWDESLFPYCRSVCDWACLSYFLPLSWINPFSPPASPSLSSVHPGGLQEHSALWKAQTQTHQSDKRARLSRQNNTKLNIVRVRAARLYRLLVCRPWVNQNAAKLGTVESAFQCLIPVLCDKTSWHKGKPHPAPLSDRQFPFKWFITGC